MASVVLFAWRRWNIINFAREKRAANRYHHVTYSNKKTQKTKTIGQYTSTWCSSLLCKSNSWSHKSSGRWKLLWSSRVLLLSPPEVNKNQQIWLGKLWRLLSLIPRSWPTLCCLKIDELAHGKRGKSILISILGCSLYCNKMIWVGSSEVAYRICLHYLN